MLLMAFRVNIASSAGGFTNSLQCTRLNGGILPQSKLGSELSGQPSNATEVQNRGRLCFAVGRRPRTVLNFVAPVVLSGTDDVEDAPIGSQKAAEIPERGELGSKM